MERSLDALDDRSFHGHPARRASVVLNYEGVNISADLAPHLISFTYTDNAADKADDLSVTLEDRAGRWRGAWFPDKGSTLTASIVTHDWESPGSSWSLPCGVFQIDQIECSGKPTQVTLKAVSTFPRSHMRQERVTSTWENVPLSAIAGDIAGRCGLELFFDSGVDPLFEVRTQVETSNLGYIQGLAHDYGLGVKVADGKLIIYEEQMYEKKNASGIIRFDDRRVEKYSFTSKTNDTYKKAHLQYHDPVKNETYDVYAEDAAEGTERVLELCDRADSEGDALLLAKQKLHDRNKREKTASITLFGTMRFAAGNTVQVQGWGNFDGTWFIDRVTHNIGRGGGYTTKVDLRLHGGGDGKKKAGGSDGGSLVHKGDDVYGGGR